MILSSELEFEIVESETTIYNKSNGAWITFDNEYVSVLLESIEKKLNINSEIEKIENEIIKSNMLNLYDKMIEYEMIVYQQVKEKLKKVYISVSNNCNLRCKHCINDSATGSINALQLTDFEEIAKSCQKIGVEQIILSGGEPLYRADIEDIINIIKANFHGKLILSTNGLLLNEYSEIVIEKVDFVDISLDGYDSNSVKKVRGVGVYEKVCDNIRSLQKENYNQISLSMVNVDRKQETIDKFQQLCQSLEVKSVIRRLCPSGRALSNYEKELVMKDNKVEELKKSNCKKCKPGIREIYINYDKKVYSCPMIQEIVTVYQGSFVQVVEEAKIHCSNIKFNFNGKCQNCKHKMYCWNCEGYYRSLLKLDFFDEICTMKKIKYDSLCSKMK